MRNFFRERGVYTGPNGNNFIDQLPRIMELEKYPPWPVEEMKSQVSPRRQDLHDEEGRSQSLHPLTADDNAVPINFTASDDAIATTASDNAYGPHDLHHDAYGLHD